ncbi:transcription antitermination factor NusB [Desulfocurvus sp.]|jgi:N utilization substance protein B|uniref:transcription antitermination factor NusB n=1 Tax=Desulfocurvus sp. TaxID=2871698 RepID=UPI0025C62584|nr:transcription antitermination factor NusB [Desulfocurvus sp.]MCK9239830.1 transcription antitermination factor NusB [Desulfocurvus sp.]
MNTQKKGGRRSGRRRAFEVLYGLCFAPPEGDDTARAVALAPEARQEQDQDTPPEPADGDDGHAQGREEFARALVAGVWSRRQDLDETINRFSQHWKLARIARVELTILRVALYEMLYLDDIPLKVAINEAVELAKRYGDDNSKNFVNGILDAVARAVEHGELRVR